MYNTIKLSLLDQNIHKFLWRILDQIKPPDHYQPSAVPFGDNSSSTISLVALQKTAELEKKKYPDAAEVILKNTYVDNILNSVNRKEDAIRLAVKVEVLLTIGGFKLRNWMFSEDNNKSIDIRNAVFSRLNRSEINQGKELGMLWDPLQDIFRFQVKVNYSLKKGKQYTVENLLTLEDL